MADTPNNDRPGPRASLRPSGRAEALSALLSQPLQDEAKVLDALVAGLATGETTRDLFKKLHEAAVAQERSANLSFSYERLARDPRIKVLPKPKQAEFFLAAASFFADVFEDAEAAIGYAERAYQISPDDEGVFDVLETLLASTQEGEKLAKLYTEGAARAKSSGTKLRLLRAAVELLEAYEGKADDVTAIQRQIVELDPTDALARGSLERLYLATRRFKELATLLEQSVSKGTLPRESDEEIRFRLIGLYRADLRDPNKAVAHVEALLTYEPINPAALQAAEALIDHKSAASRIAPLLSAAYHRLGRLEDEASTLALELKLARPPRLAEVHRRLAVLRQDVLGDPAGALELLEPLVARDPTDEDLRRRYLEVATTFHREVEAAKLLSRALPSVKDLLMRARLGLEIAGLYSKHDDGRRARATLEQLLDEPIEDMMRLVLAKRLVELHQDAAEPKGFARALEFVIKVDPDFPSRVAAAKRLVELCEGPVDDPKIAVVAWRALLGSPKNDEAVDRLETLYGKTGDQNGLAELFAYRATRAKDPAEARSFALRASEIRAAHSPDRAAAIAVWREFTKHHGPSREIHDKLAILLEQQRDFSGLVAMLETDLELFEQGERASVLGRVAKLKLSELKDSTGALDAIRRALAVDPNDVACRRMAEKLLADGDRRLEAADILEPLYRAERNTAGAIRILEARGALLTEPASRLAALDEAYRAASESPTDADRVFELAGRALGEAARHRRGELSRWLSRFKSASERSGDANRRAELLAAAATGLPVDGSDTAELARETAEAFAASGDLPRAIETYRRVLAFDPSSEEVLRRVDELLAEQGNPEERLALYKSALAQPNVPERRRELLFAVARILRRDLKDAKGAADALLTLVTENPPDMAAHQALVDVYAELGDGAALCAELERGLKFAEGDRRGAIVLRLAKELRAIGERARALALYRDVLASDGLPMDALVALEALAEEQNEPETLSAVLDKRILRATDEAEQASCLEKLGDVRSRMLGDSAGATDAWRKALLLARNIAGETERVGRLCERLLDALPDDADAAGILVDAYADGGVWSKVPGVLSVLLRADKSQRPVDLLLSFEPRAEAAGAVDEFAAMIDEALGREQESGGRTRDLIAAKARVLSSVPSRRRETSEIWKGLVESYGKPEDMEAYRQFLDKEKDGAITFDDQRWLFAFRAERATDRAPVLLDWATTEESTFGDPARAIEVYEQVLDADAGNTRAREALFRLQFEHGDPEHLLRTLRSLRERVTPEDALGVDLGIAALLVERLDRADEALPILRAAFDRAPGHPEALRLAGEALRNPKSRTEAAELVGSVAAQAEGPSADELLSRLIAETKDAPDVRSARASWYRRLIELRSGDPTAALAVAVDAAESSPEEDSLWDAAERLSRKAGDPKVVVEAYRRALTSDITPEVAEPVGRRFVEFHEEWFDDPETVLALLERVLKLAPRARWAIDRVKLAYNADARWPELFALYDRAIDGALDDDEREDLLDEAAVAAKDLANDSERAISYLERRNALRPDTRVDALLERLYERTGHSRELLGLLEKRAKSQKGPDLVKIEVRIARLRIGLGDAKGAFAVLEHVLGENPEENATYGLLEQLLELPGEAPPAGKKGKGKRPKNVRTESVRILESRYRATGDRPGLSRALEAALRLAESDKDRKERLTELVDLYVDDLGDPARGYDHLATLIALDPRSPEYRERLAVISKGIGAEERRATLLAGIARSTSDAKTKLTLQREAAAVREEIGDQEGASDAYATALELAAGDAESTLEITRRLDPLLAALGRPRERCDVLDCMLTVERDRGLRSAAFGTLASVAFAELHDADRAVRAWNARLDESPGDLEAMAGLEAVLDHSSRHAELVELLGKRIAVSSRDESRADRVRVARIYAEKIGDPAAAVETWRTIREVFGPDQETFDALFSLLEQSARWDDLAALVDATAAGASRDAQIELYRLLGDLHRDRTKNPIRALEAYVRAGDFARTMTVADNISDRETIKLVTSTLIDLTVKVWGTVDPERAEEVANAAHWAVETLVRRHLEDGALEAVVETQLRGASLPFDRTRKRKLRRDAAWTSCDRLEDVDRAIVILKELFAEDPSDEVAAASVTRFARLLDESGRYSDLAALWEEQARCREASGDRAGAAALWERAGDLTEEKLDAVERAVAAYRHGAALGGEGSLEALARIYTDRRNWRSAASVLEWLCAQSARKDLGQRALRLADAYQNLGDWERARARLEQASATAIDADPVRQRLAELYRRHAAWEPLANLLVAEVDRASDDKARLILLKEAASLHQNERNDPGAAVPLLERAVEIDSEEPTLRITLSEALRACGRYDAAAEVLRVQIASYGQRRPKNRALVHLYLARVRLAAGQRAEALSELDIGAKINPAHAGILYELGRLAFEEEQFARAERTYRALLLVLRKPDEDAAEAPGRAEIYLDLAEIAARQGEPDRASELVESAFEAALDNAKDAASLERSLKKSGRYDLLARSVETRLSAASQPALAARALSDLVLLHAEHLGVTKDVEVRVQADAARIYGELEARDVRDADAWAAMTSVYEWLGDGALEERSLERRVEAMLASAAASDPEPLLRLARVRLGDEARRDEGVALMERALSSGADRERVLSSLFDASTVSPKHPGILGLLERLSREPGREPDFVRVTMLRAEAGPVDAQTIREAVDLAVEFGDSPVERRMLEAALVNGSDSYDARDSLWLRERLARLLLAQGDPEEGDRARAAKLLAEASDSAEEEQARALGLEAAGIAASELGELTWAAELYCKCLDRNRADRDAWEPLLDVYRRLGDSTRLIALIESTAPMVDSVADRARLRLEEATLMLAEPGRKEDAVDLLKQILDDDPTLLEAADLLAKTLDELGRLDELVSLLSSQVDVAKSAADARSVELLSLKLGALLDRSRKGEALDVYRTILNWNASSREALRAVARLEGELRPGSDGEIDAMERLLPIEEPERVGALARRLVEIRMQEGDLTAVERVLEAAGNATPLDASLREHLVAALLEKADWGHAARVLRRASESDPSDRSLTQRAAEAYEHAGDLENAIQVIGAALAASGGDADLFVERARLFTEAGRADEALSDTEAAYAAGSGKVSDLISALEAAVERTVGEVRVGHALRLVDLLEELGETTAARDHLARLLKHEPKHRNALRRLASLASAEARWDEAAATYRRLIAIEEGQGLVDAAMNLADACEHSGHIADARGGLERALETVPTSTELRGRLRQLYEATGAHRELARLLLVEGRAEPEVLARTNLLIRAAELLLEPDGDAAEATTVLEEVHRLSPENIHGAVLFARAAVTAGRPEEARSTLEAVLAAHRGRRSKDLSMVYRELSHIHLEDGDLSTALDTLARAFDLDMRNGELAMQLGHLALDVDDTDTAAKAFRSVTMMKFRAPGASEGASAESKAVAYYHLSRIAQSQGDIKKARLLATKAVSENPSHSEAQALLKELRAS